MTIRLRIGSCLLVAAIAPLAASADAVHLKNGQSFDDVETTVTGDQLHIDLGIGSMRLPMSQVDRIEEVDSALGEYRERESRLRQDASGADGWLELATWARAHDLDRGAVKAALHAARLDPELDGLATTMNSLGFVLDDGAREWVSYAESMRRQGLVEDSGDWVTPEEKRERGRVGTEVAESAGSRADDHLDKALDILAAAVSKPEAPAATVIVQPGNLGYGFGFPGFVGGGFVGGVIDGDFIDPLAPGALFRSDVNQSWNAMALRQPASFIPLAPRAAPRHIHPVTHRFTR